MMKLLFVTLLFAIGLGRHPSQGDPSQPVWVKRLSPKDHSLEGMPAKDQSQEDLSLAQDARDLGRVKRLGDPEWLRAKTDDFLVKARQCCAFLGGLGNCWNCFFGSRVMPSDLPDQSLLGKPTKVRYQASPQGDGSAARSKVLIYDDAGVSQKCRDQTLECLRGHITPNDDILFIRAEELKTGTWMNTARLLVIPGGRDLPFVEKLEPVGTDLIRKFVRSGGIYLGICAGAYFATTRVEFEVDRPVYKVVGDRRLALVQAVAKGAAFPGFDYMSEAGARAATVKLQVDNKASPPFYFNGGPYFEILDNANVHIIGNYEDGRVAIVKARFGEGLVILSGVHFEFDPSASLRNDIVDTLKEFNKDRIDFLSYLKRTMDDFNHQKTI